MANDSLSKFDKFIKIYKIILSILYLGFTLFVSITLIYQYFADMKAINNPDASLQGLGMALFVVIFGIIGSGIGYGVLELISIGGLITVSCSKTVSNKKKEKAFFILSLLVNIITYILLIVFAFILNNSLQAIINK